MVNNVLVLSYFIGIGNYVIFFITKSVEIIFAGWLRVSYFIYSLGAVIKLKNLVGKKSGIMHMGLL